jgi:hypothetical protein
MPRYFFHCDAVEDREGTDCPHVESARSMAIRTAAAMLGEAADDVRSDWRMTVTDEHQRAVLELRFSVEFPNAAGRHSEPAVDVVTPLRTRRPILSGLPRLRLCDG